MTQKSTETRTCDVLIIGSGAPALTAAVRAAHQGLDVIVAEKEPVLGGTSAWSGGWLWVPRNPLAVRGGIIEDIEGPRTYLRSELGNKYDDALVDAFLEEGPKMVSFLEEKTEMEFLDGNVVPDFHTSEGYRKGGRSVTAKPYDARALGKRLKDVRPPLDIISLKGKMGIAAGADINHLINATRSFTSFIYVCKRFLSHAKDLITHGRSMHLVAGNALVARLYKSALDLNVSFSLEHRASGLIKEDNHVTGAIFATPEDRVEIRATKGVVLGTGGYPHDKERQKKQFPYAGKEFAHYSAAPKTNTGDGIRIAEDIGAHVSDDLVHPAAWAPVTLVPRKDGTVGHFPHLFERAKPGIIAVTADGERFTNEANSYHDFMSALLKKTPEGTQPKCWLIADHKAQRRFGLGWAKPFPYPLNSYIKSGYLKRGKTLTDLAEACGIDAPGFEKTVQRLNSFAHQGEDPDFKRGDSAYNKIQGDAFHGPNPSLGALEKGPFFAVEIYPGSLGTFSGLKTNSNAQVIDTQSHEVIDGLYAVGNDMSSMMGGNYPSGGITLGPGMTFAYIAANHIAKHTPSHSTS